MKAAIVTPVRILGDGLAQALRRRRDITVVAVTTDVPALRRALAEGGADVALIDVTQSIDLEEVRAVAADYLGLALVALGLREQHQEVIRCGRAGFCGYVRREAELEELCAALANAAAGRLACPPEISSELLKALFRGDSDAPRSDLPVDCLTRREGEILSMMERGLGNKEIARELSLSVATVKHHVHGVLSKLRVGRRSLVMRRVRNDLPASSLPPPDPGRFRASSSEAA